MVEESKVLSDEPSGVMHIDNRFDGIEFSRREELTVVVQAGGESRRMGRSKATVPFLGEPFVLRNLRAFAPIAGELMVTTNEPENLGFISDVFGEGTVRLVRDVFDRRGALFGLQTALSEARTEFVAVVAVDMAFADPRLVIAELDALEDSDADLAIPHVAEGFEPFHAVYRREACLPGVRAVTAKGNPQASGWYTADTKMIEFDENRIASVVGDADCFSNANTPTELAELEYRAVSGT